MNHRFRLLTVIVLVTAGILVMVYPAVSSYINTLHSSRAIQQFSDQIKTAGVDSLREQRRLAQAYNHSLSEGMALTDAEYDRILDFGNGIMGFIRLPAIGTELPIYHGVSDAVLQKGAGHLPGSALPIGGAGTHCILTGHTGLPGAELFTGLSELTLGDPFTLHVLDEVLVYAVDQIRVVLPHEVDDLVAADGHDYCTLVTCTPYGINSHRLLVRGERVHDGEAPMLPKVPEASDGHTPPAASIPVIAALAMPAAVGVLVLRKRRKDRP